MTKRPVALSFIRSLGSTGVLGMALVLLVVVMAVFAPILAPHDPAEQDLLQRLVPPGTDGYLLGSDNLGRDMLSRIIYGARTPLIIATSAVFLGAVLGGVLGAAAGFFRGWTDRIVMRLADIQLSMPAVLIALTVVAVIGSQLQWLIVVLALSVWPTTARVVRSEALSVREREFVQASRTIGTGPGRILRTRVAHHILGPLTVIATLELGQTILLAAALSFLGLGVQPPTPDWGLMMSEGRDYLQTAWWITTFPGIALMILVVGCNLIGDALRDHFDPKAHEGGRRRRKLLRASVSPRKADVHVGTRAVVGQQAGAGSDRISAEERG